MEEIVGQASAGEAKDRKAACPGHRRTMGAERWAVNTSGPHLTIADCLGLRLGKLRAAAGFPSKRSSIPLSVSYSMMQRE